MPPDLAHAQVTAIASSQYAMSEALVVECETRYDRGARAPAYWATWDLRGSASYRLAAGDRSAYVRLEVFVETTRRMLDAFGPEQVQVFKELGDAVLVRATGMRPLIETACLLTMVSDLWSAPRDASDPTLVTRCAITHGVAVQLHRSAGPDFVGSAIDRLARLSSEMQPDECLALVDEAAYDSDSAIFAEYDFLRAEGPHLLDRAKLKAGESPVRNFAIAYDRRGLANSRAKFETFR